MFMSEEQYAQNAEENARGLIVMYGSHVIETQKNLDETLSVARMHLKALQAAREQKNGPAIARALAAAKETASRAKVLTTQRTKYEQLLGAAPPVCAEYACFVSRSRKCHVFLCRAPSAC